MKKEREREREEEGGPHQRGAGWCFRCYVWLIWTHLFFPFDTFSFFSSSFFRLIVPSLALSLTCSYALPFCPSSPSCCYPVYEYWCVCVFVCSMLTFYCCVSALICGEVRENVLCNAGTENSRVSLEASCCRASLQPFEHLDENNFPNFKAPLRDN